MKTTFKFLLTGLLINAFTISFSFAQYDLLYEREIQQCYYSGEYVENSPGGCGVIIEQWYSPIFNQSGWDLVIECDDGSSGSWSGTGVYSGSACNGDIGYGGGSSGGGSGGGGDGFGNEALYDGGVDIDIKYGDDK